MAGKILIAGKDPGKLNVNMPSAGFIDKAAVKKADTEGIVTAEPFISLFRIKEEILKAIVESMLHSGFDENQPVIIWKEKNVLIDGHTRLQAAKAAGISTIPVFYASFETEDDVLDYMNRLQFNRRNIADGDLIRLIINALPLYEKKYGEGSKAEFLTKRFTGLSEAKAKKLIIVIEKGTEQQIQTIINEEESINNIYKLLLKDKKAPKEKVRANFFENEGEKRLIRTDDNGNFYFRNYEKMKEIKAFALPKYLNSERIRGRIMKVIEEEMGGSNDGKS